MRTLKELKSQHPIIAKLKNEEGGWKNEHIAATVLFDDQLIEYLSKDLSHRANADGSPYAEPECVEIWFGIDFPLETIDFRILGGSDRGLWIDSGEGRIGSHAVLIPWTSIFAIHIHSEQTVKSNSER